MAQNRTDTSPTPTKRPKIETTENSTSSQEKAEDEIRLVEEFCMHLRSSDILEEGYEIFTVEISPCDLPSVKRFCEELIPQEYNKARTDLMKTFESVHSVAISIETWTWGETDEDNMLTATAHFVHPSKFILKINTLFTIKLHCSEDNAKAITDELTGWGILQKVVCFIMNSGINKSPHYSIITAISSILKIPILECTAGKINDLIQKGLSHLNFTDLEMKCQNKPLIKKKKDDPFYWHDQYNMLKQISDDNEGDFSSEERKGLSECFDILKPFGELNNRLSEHSYIPIPLMIPYFKTLLQEIREYAPSTCQAKELKKKLLPTNIFSDLTYNGLALKATFLNPSLKHHAPSQRKEVKKELIERISSYYQRTSVGTTKNQAGANNTELDHSTDDCSNLADASSLAIATLSVYDRIRRLRSTESILKFWKKFDKMSKCNEFYMMALKYFSIPATATPVPLISEEMEYNINNKNKYENSKFFEYEDIDKILFLRSCYVDMRTRL